MLNIPEPVIDYVRMMFAEANSKVTMALSQQPSLHEETLDHALVSHLSAAPPMFFAAARAAVAIETHWLGGRRMYGRWEIADIALIIIIREAGRLATRKVALLQTKRLYSREIPTVELEDADYTVGIGRIADRTENLLPLTKPRTFTFVKDCVYGAMRAGDGQQSRIDQYSKEKGLPVYYAFYNPPNLPFEGQYPQLAGKAIDHENKLGVRVLSAPDVHKALSLVVVGKPPTFDEMAARPSQASDRFSDHGWRLEGYVADEVLRCREGKAFDGEDASLRALFYERSAPISSAISITIDFERDGSRAG